jgi:MYXO-CTERM domain-containing protein
MKPKLKKSVITQLAIPILAISSTASDAAVYIGTWEFNNSLAVTNTTALPGVAISALTDLNPTLVNTTRTLTATTLNLSRNNDAPDSTAWSFVNGVAASPTWYSFTVANTTGADITLDSISVQLASGGNLNFRLTQANNTTLLTPNAAAIGTTVAVAPFIAPYTTPTPSPDTAPAQPFIIADGATTEFRWDLNSGALDSTHSIEYLRVTGTAVPEPSAALLGGLGLLAMLRRRRN